MLHRWLVVRAIELGDPYVVGSASFPLLFTQLVIYVSRFARFGYSSVVVTLCGGYYAQFVQRTGQISIVIFHEKIRKQRFIELARLLKRAFFLQSAGLSEPARSRVFLSRRLRFGQTERGQRPQI